MFPKWSILVTQVLYVTILFAQSSAEMTDQEKVASWKSEKVILLGIPFSGEHYHPYLKSLRRPKEPLLYDHYVGKTGVITDAKMEPFRGLQLLIRPDDSGEDITAESPADNALAFLSEMAIAKKIVEDLKGQPLWSKGKLQLYGRETEESLKSNTSTVFEVSSLSKLTILQAE